jgi:hypothetical protein
MNQDNNKKYYKLSIIKLHQERLQEYFANGKNFVYTTLNEFAIESFRIKFPPKNFEHLKTTGTSGVPGIARNPSENKNGFEMIFFNQDGTKGIAQVSDNVEGQLDGTHFFYQTFEPGYKPRNEILCKGNFQIYVSPENYTYKVECDNYNAQFECKNIMFFRNGNIFSKGISNSLTFEHL